MDATACCVVVLSGNPNVASLWTKDNSFYESSNSRHDS
jgi:hypothetical protein